MLALLWAYVAWLVPFYDYHFIDGVNLAVHEAGHLIFGFFGRTVYFLGGTLAQLLFPAAFVVYFATRGERYEACVMSIWLAESMMYAARYIGDAQAQILPLVGGHIHDWNWLLSRWGMLEQCEKIATVVHTLASVVAIAALVLAAYDLSQHNDRATSSDELI